MIQRPARDSFKRFEYTRGVPENRTNWIITILAAILVVPVLIWLLSPRVSANAYKGSTDN